MAELKINIDPEKEPLLIMLVEELGGEVVKEKQQSKNRKNKVSAKKPSPTFLFGKWKNFDIDARKLREEAWGRKF